MSPEDAAYAQVQRVVNSTTFRNTEVLRRLLKFLAVKSIAGEAEQLKEYTVAIDGLGKPASYDPRSDSLVRIQIGRLRNKLADYYRKEGERDPVLLDVPKGHFKVVWQTRPIPSSLAEPVAPVPAQLAARTWSRTQIGALAVLAVWAVVATFLWLQERRDSYPLREAWTPELQELWQPFLESKRDLIVAVSSPLFVGFQGSGFYRDQNLNQWDEVLASSKVQAIRKVLKDPAILERYYYTGLGETSAAFRLGKLADLSGMKISVTRSSLISWQQIVDNNVLFVGAARVFRDQLSKLPVNLDLQIREGGVYDRRAEPGTPALFADNYPSIGANEASSTPDDGEVYALVSHMPGPLGSGDIQTFNSNHSPGVQAAVQWFTDPAFARQLTSKLRRRDGRLPRYFQLVLKVRYRDAVPTEISYVTHRELHTEITSNRGSQ
jgi:hypothetical protein